MRNELHPPTNPFTYGALALDDAFTDRETELRDLVADMENGQDVVLYAPRRFGKSSLVLRASQRAVRHGILVGYCDLMRTTTKERFAAALAKTIYADIESPGEQVLERAAGLFRGLRVRPTMEVDPDDLTLRFTFQAGRRAADIDDTIERLLELPGRIAAERKRRVAIVFDEFQEVVGLDRNFPNLMRAVFQTQPEIGHVYLGSKRHVLERIFNDRNEPFWRSAKQVELGPIAPAKFAPFIRKRFDQTEKAITPEALERLLGITAGHPYATQELGYAIWQLVPPGHHAFPGDVDTALDQVLRSEHNHFARIWDEAPAAQRLLMLALAEEPASAVYSAGYRERHDLPGPSSIGIALQALERKEIAGRSPGGDRTIVEPFLAEWLRREQRPV
jgi:uncharacterized protein